MGDYAWGHGTGGMGLIDVYPGGIPRDETGGLVSINTPPGVPVHTAGLPLTAQQIKAAGLTPTIPPTAWFDPAPKTNWGVILGVVAFVWFFTKKGKN